MKAVNYARLAVALERGETDAMAVSRALAAIVMARADGAKGMGASVDAVLEKLLAEIGEK